MWICAGLGNPGSKYEGTPHNVGFQAIINLIAGLAETSGRSTAGRSILNLALPVASNPKAKEGEPKALPDGVVRPIKAKPVGTNAAEYVWQITSPEREQFRGHVARSTLAPLVPTSGLVTHEVILVRPQTFMNLSGDCLGEVARYYKVEPARVIVLHDDVDLPLGKIRVKLGGGSGGHNGIKSISEHIGAEYFRIKIGVGRGVGSGPVEGGVQAAINRPEGLADFVLGKFDREGALVVKDSLEKALAAAASLMVLGLGKTQNAFNR